MERNGRLLGWIAIAIGVVALVVALTGRDTGLGWRYNRDVTMFRGVPGAQFSQPQAPQAPVPPQQFERRFEERGAMRGGHGPFGGHRPFFMWPFMMFGWLFRLFFWGLLIVLLLRLVRGPGWWKRRGPGGPAQGGGSNAPPNTPNEPSDPPYSGETRAL